MIGTSLIFLLTGVNNWFRLRPYVLIYGCVCAYRISSIGYSCSMGFDRSWLNWLRNIKPAIYSLSFLMKGSRHRQSRSFFKCRSNKRQFAGEEGGAGHAQTDTSGWTYWVWVADGHLLGKAHFRRVGSQLSFFGCTYEGRLGWLRI